MQLLFYIIYNNIAKKTNKVISMSLNADVMPIDSEFYNLLLGLLLNKLTK